MTMNRKRSVGGGRKPTEPAVHATRLKSERLWCWVDDHPMEQAEAAELLGVSRQTWSLWETGRRGMSRHYYNEWRIERAPYFQAVVDEVGDPVTSEGGRWTRKAEPAVPMPAPADPMGPTDATGGSLPDASEMEAAATAPDQ